MPFESKNPQIKKKMTKQIGPKEIMNHGSQSSLPFISWKNMKSVSILHERFFFFEERKSKNDSQV